MLKTRSYSFVAGSTHQIYILFSLVFMCTQSYNVLILSFQSSVLAFSFMANIECVYFVEYVWVRLVSTQYTNPIVSWQYNIIFSILFRGPQQKRRHAKDFILQFSTYLQWNKNTFFFQILKSSLDSFVGII